MNRDVRELIADRIEEAARKGNSQILHTISAFAAQAQYLADRVFEAKEENPDIDVDDLVALYERDNEYYRKCYRELRGFAQYGELEVGNSFVLEADASKRGATSYLKTDVPGVAVCNDCSGRTLTLTDDTVVCATAW